MDSVAAPTAEATIAAEVAALIDLLRQRQFAQVLQAAPALLARTPGQRDVLLALAVAQRMLGKLTEALRTLALLQRQHPLFSRLYEERGRCFVELRQAPQAIEAFRQAVDMNHALPGSWSMLEGLYRMRGESADATVAAGHVATLRALPPQVVTASGLFADGELESAEAMVRAFLLRHGDHIEAMRLLARIGMAHKVYLDAQILLAAVLERVPDYKAARTEYAFVLLELHRFEEARRELERLLKHDPHNVALRSFYAASCAGLGEHERSVALYRELLTGGVTDADIYLSIGHAQKTLGHTVTAIESYRQAAATRADFGDAYWSLANLKTYRFTPEELARMQARLAAPATPLIDRYHLCFALGKALEDQATSPAHSATTRWAMSSSGPSAAIGRKWWSATLASRSRCAQRRFSPRAPAGASPRPTRSSLSDCRAQARRCSSRSSPTLRGRRDAGVARCAADRYPSPAASTPMPGSRVIRRILET